MQHQDPNALFKHAFQLQQMGALNDAEILYKKILEIGPAHLGAKTMLGIILIQSERDQEGIKLLEASLKKDPKQFWAYNSLGVGLLNTKQYQKAFFSLNKAIALKPDYIDAYFNLAKVQRALGKYCDAIASYSKCLALNINFEDAWSNRGTIYLEDLNEKEKALFDYQEFLKRAPNSWIGFYHMGNALKALGRYKEALVYYERAILLNPDYAEAYCNKGMALFGLKRHDEALVHYDRAIQLNPDYPEAFGNRGGVFCDLKRYDEALADYQHAIQFKHKYDYLLGALLYVKMHLCNWDSYDQLLNELLNKTKSQEKISTPFVVLALTDDACIQKQTALIFSKDTCPISYGLPNINKYLNHQKIRVGYFSADFREHPVSYLTAELFELHNRDQFEVIAFSFGVDPQDDLRKRLEMGFDQFLDVSDQTDQEIAMLAREIEIDIAVDLGGFTADSRTNIFAMRAAPIQVNYLGYAGTMAAEYIDYIVADQIVIPVETQSHYSEKVAYLPKTFMVNDATLKPSEQIFFRTDFNLPEDRFIFACFNASYKITPPTFQGWMRILKAVDSSVLWLSSMNETAMNNLKDKAVECGVDRERIIFAPRMPSVSDHLNRIKFADLFLDTFPYNAHTTSNDALRMGLPVLTLMGESFASRVAASLLNAVDMSELITNSQEAYEALAIELATNSDKHMKLRKKLLSNLPTSALLNTKNYTKHLESAYLAMYQRYQEDLKPDHIHVVN